MEHLKKDGHLLKNSSGHLINVCGGPSTDCTDCVANCNGSSGLTITVTKNSECTGGCAGQVGQFEVAGQAVPKSVSDCTWFVQYNGFVGFTISCGSNQWNVDAFGTGLPGLRFTNTAAALSCSGDHPTGTVVLPIVDTGLCGPDCNGTSITVVIS